MNKNIQFLTVTFAITIVIFFASNQYIPLEEQHLIPKYEFSVKENGKSYLNKYHRVFREKLKLILNEILESGLILSVVSSR